jgi:hypothetical protein
MSCVIVSLIGTAMYYGLDDGVSFPLGNPLIYFWLTFLFPKLKIAKKWTRLEAVSSIQQNVTTELKALGEEAFSRAFDSLCERYKRCAEAGADYIG